MQNSIYKIFVISVLGLGGVVFHSAWGVIPPPPHERNTAWNRGRIFFHCLGAPNNLIRPWLQTHFLLEQENRFWSIESGICRCGSVINLWRFRITLLPSHAKCLPFLRNIHIYRLSQEECARLRESVPYVIIYRENTKHLYPKLNCYGDNVHRKVWSCSGSLYCTCLADGLSHHVHVVGLDRNARSAKLNQYFNTVGFHMPCTVLGTLRTTTALVRVFM
jgi:hypothetical protein